MNLWLFMLQDFRYGVRQLSKSPGFALTVLLSIALGIGATTAVFSVVYGVLINPYPYRNADRLVHLVLRDKAGRERWPGLTGTQIEQLRTTPGVESVTGQNDWSLTTTGEDLPDDVEGVYLTPNAFQHFGVPALLGREFGPVDAPNGRDPQPVAVLSYKFWQRHFGGDRSAVGRPLQLDHRTYEVIGVMPAMRPDEAQFAALFRKLIAHRVAHAASTQPPCLAYPSPHTTERPIRAPA